MAAVAIDMAAAAAGEAQGLEAAAEHQGTEAVVARLRAQIARVQAAPRQYLASLRTGVAALDALGAFRLGGVIELSGALAGGRTSLALSLVAAAGREQRLSAWVDGPGELYPPAAAVHGVDLARVLWVRRPPPGQLVWAAAQLARSGAFTCVVLDVTGAGVRLTPVESRKLLDAARAGGTLLVVLTPQGVHGEGLPRLELLGGASEIEVQVPKLQRRLCVPRAALGGPSVPWRPCPLMVAAPRPEWPRGEPFVRPKKNLARDGHGIRSGGRPGRDGPEAPVRQWLAPMAVGA